MCLEMLIVDKRMEKFLVNLYEYENGNPKGYYCVADCLEGEDTKIIRELDTVGFINAPGSHYYNDKGESVIDGSHHLTERGKLYLKSNNLI